jgi:hypothetical protein
MFQSNLASSISCQLESFLVRCYLRLCNRLIQTEANCFKQQADLCNKATYQSKPNESADVLPFSAPIYSSLATTQNLSHTIFIATSLNLPPCLTAVTYGDNETMYSQAKGSFKGTVRNTDHASFPTFQTFDSTNSPSPTRFNMISSNLADVMVI